VISGGRFKSIRIAADAVETVRSKEDRHVRRIYADIHRTSENSGLAVCAFKAIAHRVLAGDPCWGVSP